MKKHMVYIVLGVFFLGIILSDQAVYARWFDSTERVLFSTETKTLNPDIACIDVKGAVIFPDIYCLPSYLRVSHAILSAGGLQDQAETTMINLSQKISDGMMIYIPRFNEEVKKDESKISINKASHEQLVSLPGIGTVTASAIVAYREEHGPFLTIEGIMQVSGIGATTFANIQNLISI